MPLRSGVDSLASVELRTQLQQARRFVGFPGGTERSLARATHDKPLDDTSGMY